MKDGKKHIGEIADFYGISADAIRYYEKIGLFSLSREKNNNYRKFDREHLLFIDYIKNLRDMGIPLNKVKLISRELDVAEVDKVLEKQSDDIKKKIDELQKKQAMLYDYRRAYKRILEGARYPEVVRSPRFICTDINESAMEALKRFRDITSKRVPRLTYKALLKEWDSEEWKTPEKASSRGKLLSELFSVECDENDDFCAPEKDFYTIEPCKCIHCIISLHTYKDYSGLKNIHDYIDQNEIELVGAPLIRTLYLKYCANAYYEFWGPVK